MAARKRFFVEIMTVLLDESSVGEVYWKRDEIPPRRFSFCASLSPDGAASMPQDPEWFDEPDNELDESEYPDEDESDDDSTETAPCPHCGAEVYEDAVRCPVCGEYVTTGGNIWSGRPLWWIVLAVLGIAATVAALAIL
jgi:hypothetical protein